METVNERKETEEINVEQQNLQGMLFMYSNVNF